MEERKVHTCSIAVLPGDGIGPEVITEALRVLNAVAGMMPNTQFDCTEYPAGAGAYREFGDPLPDATFAACQEADAVLLGAMGLPDVRWPDGREMTPQIDLREKLDLYCGLRPVRLFHENDSPLKRYGPGEIDFLLVRESTEGLFSGRLAPASLDADLAEDRMRITRRGSERLFRSAFAEARKRRHLLTLVDKANVLPSMAYFRAIFDQVAADFPDVRTECIYVDAAALYLVQRPHTFDVLVTENMFGDILSDLGAGLVGGMGMAPSADIGDDAAVFQPAHGTAPDIAGKGIANPVATILSLAMLLDWLGTPETQRAANRITTATERALSDPTCRTPDLGGKLGTPELTDAILAELVRS